MARVTTAGEVTAAKAIAPALAVAAPSLHVGVSLETFCYPAGDTLVTVLADTRFSVDATTKARLSATDKAITWES